MSDVIRVFPELVGWCRFCARPPHNAVGLRNTGISQMRADAVQVRF